MQEQKQNQEKKTTKQHLPHVFVLMCFSTKRHSAITQLEHRLKNHVLYDTNFLSRNECTWESGGVGWWMEQSGLEDEERNRGSESRVEEN